MILKKTIITLAVLVVIVFVIGYVFSANDAIKVLDRENDDIFARLEKAEENLKKEETKLDYLKTIAYNSRTDLPVISQGINDIASKIDDSDRIIDEKINGKKITDYINNKTRESIILKEESVNNILNKWLSILQSKDASKLSIADIEKISKDLGLALNYVSELRSEIKNLEKIKSIDSIAIQGEINNLDQIINSIQNNIDIIANIANDQKWELENNVLSSYSTRDTVTAQNPTGLVVTTSDILNQETVVNEAKKAVEQIQTQIDSQNIDTNTSTNVNQSNTPVNNVTNTIVKDPSVGDSQLPSNLSPYMPKATDPSKPRLLQGMNPEY